MSNDKLLYISNDYIVHCGINNWDILMFCFSSIPTGVVVIQSIHNIKLTREVNSLHGPLPPAEPCRRAAQPPSGSDLRARRYGRTYHQHPAHLHR